MKLKKTFAFLLALTTLGSQLAIPANSAELFGDINGDGAINALDAAGILQYAAYVGAGGTLDLKGFLNGEEEQPDNGVTDEDDTLTILAWTDYDLDMMLDCYREDYPDADVEIILAGENGGGAEAQYKTILQSGEQIDLYMAEPNWVRSYIDDEECAAPLSAVGLTEEDYADAYSYAVEQGRNKNGELYAASYYVAPGGYVYNAALAKEHLGINTPEEMQACISDWDGFTATADRLHKATQGSVTMTATMAGMWQAFSAAPDRSVMNGDKLNTANYEEFTKLAKTFIDNGYVDPEILQWTPEWDEPGIQGTTLGYFLPTWIVEENSGIMAMFKEDADIAITAGPQNYYWGGMYLCVSPNCNSASEAEQFLRYFTVNADSMQKFGESSGNMVTNRTAIASIIESGEHKNVRLGGADEYAVLHQVAEDIEVDAAEISEWDEKLNNQYYNVLYNNYTMTSEEILKLYQELVFSDYGIQAETAK